MSIFTGIIVFLLSWWIMLFAVLPWGQKMPDDQELGNAASAPIKPYLKIKFAVTTVLAALSTSLIYWLINSNIIDLRSGSFEVFE